VQHFPLDVLLFNLSYSSLMSYSRKRLYEQSHVLWAVATEMCVCVCVCVLLCLCCI